MSEAFWVDGTRSTIRLDGSATGGRLALLEETLPPGPGPPLHSHPESETFLVLEGALTLWILPTEAATVPFTTWPAELAGPGLRCEPGSASFVPGGAPHTYAVTGTVARILVISAPAGLELWTRELGVPATGSGLPPAGGVATISPEQRRRFASEHRLRRLGPPPPTALT